MMLLWVPPLIIPTVTTAGCVGKVWRLTIVWIARTNCEAMTMGSLVDAGIAPWPPTPRMVTKTVIAPAIAGPEVIPTLPTARPALSCSATA